LPLLHQFGLKQTTYDFLTLFKLIATLITKSFHKKVLVLLCWRPCKVDPNSRSQTFCLHFSCSIIFTQRFSDSIHQHSTPPRHRGSGAFSDLFTWASWQPFDCLERPIKQNAEFFSSKFEYFWLLSLVFTNSFKCYCLIACLWPIPVLSILYGQYLKPNCSKHKRHPNILLQTKGYNITTPHGWWEQMNCFEIVPIILPPTTNLLNNTINPNVALRNIIRKRFLLECV